MEGLLSTGPTPSRLHVVEVEDIKNFKGHQIASVVPKVQLFCICIRTRGGIYGQIYPSD